MKEQPTTEFIRQIPTTFDETIALDGQLGEYVAVARRKGSTWYVAAMTDWQPRQLDIRLDMLTEGQHQIETFADGINADRDATDYQKSSFQTQKGAVLKANLMPGGAWCAIIR